MSLHDYRQSTAIISRHPSAAPEPSFYALIMAAMRRADTGNLAKLRASFPETWDELKARYDAPGGFLDGERVAS